MVVSVTFQDLQAIKTLVCGAQKWKEIFIKMNYKSRSNSRDCGVRQWCGKSILLTQCKRQEERIIFKCWTFTSIEKLNNWTKMLFHCRVYILLTLHAFSILFQLKCFWTPGMEAIVVPGHCASVQTVRETARLLIRCVERHTKGTSRPSPLTGAQLTGLLLIYKV